jgi:hypothetical protein
MIGELPRKPQCLIEPRADIDGYLYTACAEGESEKIVVWWDRAKPERAEGLVIRQEHGKVGADVIILTLGQAYDLIDALNRAVEDK